MRARRRSTTIRSNADHTATEPCYCNTKGEQEKTEGKVWKGARTGFQGIEEGTSIVVDDRDKSMHSAMIGGRFIIEIFAFRGSFATHEQP
jgi:hypothetical protein